MSLQQELEITALTQHDSIANFARHLPSRWLMAIIGAKGFATVRKRRLPLEQLIWTVIGMCLMRDRSIEEVVSKFDLALPGNSGLTVAPSSIAEGRQRLGFEPMKELFEQTAAAWGHDKAGGKLEWRGFAIYGIDGSTILLSDTPEIRAFFGVPTTGSKQGDAAFPLARVVALQASRSHVIAAAKIRPYSGSSELSLTDDLIAEIPSYSGTLVDRNFLCGRFIHRLMSEGTERHFVTRAKSTTRMYNAKELGPGDFLVELNHSDDDRKRDKTLPKRGKARAIHYQIDGGKPEILLTSLLDPVAYPKDELVELYHERWEIEITFAETKTQMLNKSTPLRSKTVNGVLQEIYGVLLAYNLVRLEMCVTAEIIGVAPNRISFITSLHAIRDEWLWFQITKPGAIPQRLQALHNRLARFLLPERRRERRYERVVKAHKRKFPVKKRAPAVDKAQGV